MMIHRITLLALLLGVGMALQAQEFNKERLDSLFSLIETYGRGMGSLSLFHNGKEVYQKSYGYADVENKVRNNAATKFRIGSITKTFTATLIMRLVEENRLSLSDKLSRFYPDIPNADTITIAHLLQHRSGIANFTNVADYFEWNTQAHTKAAILDKIQSGGVNFEPNERFEYSNSNYVLLTFIAEDISKKSYDQLLHEIIIQPCGLTHTLVGGKIDVSDNQALSYTKLSDWTLEKESDMTIPLGAGCIISTPYDLNLFFHSLFSGKIVKEESLRQMTTIVDGFGLGLLRVPFHEKRGYGHTGGIDGFQSNAFYFPEEKVSVALTANGVSYPLNDIVIAALSTYFGKEFTLPHFAEAVEVTEEDLERYTGVYASEALPIKITVTSKDKTLIGQATGQPSFPLECVEKGKFKFAPAKLVFTFIPEEGKMIFQQNGMTFELKKE